MQTSDSPSLWNQPMLVWPMRVVGICWCVALLYVQVVGLGVLYLGWQDPGHGRFPWGWSTIIIPLVLPLAYSLTQFPRPWWRRRWFK